MVNTSQVASRRTSKIEEVRALHGAGMTVRQIARHLDLSTQGVHYHLRKLGIDTSRRTA